MKKSNYIVIFCVVIFGLFLFQTKQLQAEDSPTDFRFRYSGSSVFSLPTGNCKSSASYINDDSNSSFFVSQSLGNLLEVSMLRRLSGEKKGKNTINGKLALMSEGDYCPGVSIGVVDVNKKLGDRIYFAAASKNFEDFGFSIHAGLLKDPIDDDKKTFFGVEKIILPLLTIAAERYDDINTYGIKISPYPGLSLDVAQRDGKEELFNLVYSRSY